MKTTKAKVSENIVLVPQLDDISGIQDRIVSLSEKLKNTHPYEAGIIRATALIDAVLLLEAVNFDLMKEVVDALDESNLNASIYDKNEQKITRELYSLAIDILVDIPISSFISDITEKLPPVELIEDECTAPDCDCTTWGCCGKEVESENLALEQSNYQCPSICPECEAPEEAIYNTPDEFSSTGYSWKCAVCNGILSSAPSLPKLKNWGAE